MIWQVPSKTLNRAPNIVKSMHWKSLSHSVAHSSRSYGIWGETKRFACPAKIKKRDEKNYTPILNKMKENSNNHNNIKNEDDNNIAQLTLRWNHVNSKRIVVFIFLFIYFFFFIYIFWKRLEKEKFKIYIDKRIKFGYLW